MRMTREHQPGSRTYKSMLLSSPSTQCTREQAMVGHFAQWNCFFLLSTHRTVRIAKPKSNWYWLRSIDSILNTLDLQICDHSGSVAIWFCGWSDTFSSAQFNRTNIVPSEEQHRFATCPKIIQGAKISN